MNRAWRAARAVWLALALLASAGMPPSTAAQPPSGETIELAFFFGQGCAHCAAMRDFLKDLQARQPRLDVREFEVYAHRENARLFARVAAGYRAEIEGVPGVFVGETAFSGYSAEIAARIEQTVAECSLRACGSPLARAAPAAPPAAVTLSAVLAAAAVDAINPCEFAVLFILLTAILAAGDRRRALWAGIAFSCAIFISYYLMGLGLYSAVQAAGATRAITFAVAALAIVIGLFNLKDYLWYAKWFHMEVPIAWRPAMRRVIGGVTSVPGAFFVGFVVSLFLLPCTSGPYIVILGLLAQSTERADAMLWLLLYNAVFVLPMLAITAVVYLGLATVDDLELWRTEHITRLHLVAGIILLALGVGMLAAAGMGWL